MKAGANENRENGEYRLNLRYQDKAYNESYKQWRKRNKDSAGFYFAENPDELTYQDGVGFIKDAPEAHEAKALRRTLTVLGSVLLFRVLFDAFSIYLLPGLLKAAGLDISYDIFANRMYGSDTMLITTRFVTEALSVVLPALILEMYFKLPLKVILPMRAVNKPMSKACFPAALLISGVCCAMAAAFQRVFRISSLFDSAKLPVTSFGWIYSFMTYIVVIPVISELCSGGVILQLMRQFGDGIALVLTSFITAVFCYDVAQFLFYFTAAIMIRYFTVRTGSVLVGAVMRLTVSLYSFLLFLINFNTRERFGYTFVFLFLFVTLLTGLIFTIRFLYRYSDCFGVTMKPRYMTFRRKIMWITASVPVILWFTAALIITMMNAVLTAD